MRHGWSLAFVLLLGVALSAQEGPAAVERRGVFDQILDTYVRDGYVYYHALQTDRGKLDRYVAQLGTVHEAGLSEPARLAFWLNAYNAIVLQTVIDHYPVPRRTADYPAHSIRQVPGAFERLTHQVAGRRLTLDEIEQTVLPAFHDPRVYFAIGRGAVGGGRLRSEAFSAEALESELAEVARECVTRPVCVHLDSAADALAASAIFSWRESDFVSAYADRALPVYASRSGIERAVLAFVEPALLASERAFLARNTFHVAYSPFDWSLNDLAGRGGR
jgi:hypothetical protein